MAPARWDGKSGKIPPSLINKRESKRMSPKINKSNEEIEGCKVEDWYAGAETELRKDGSPRLYSPEQIQNYKSQYARFERGLDLTASKIEKIEKNTIFWYHSCDAPDGYWKVTVGQGGPTFLNVKKILTIVCPKPYVLDESVIESDGTQFVWQQLSGNRTMLVRNETQLFATLDLLNSCIAGTGCDDGSSLPIVMKVSAADDPSLFDFLTIYNTPTSNHFGNSYKGRVSEVPCQKVKEFLPAPAFRQKAYCSFNQPIMFTWASPECDKEFITGYTLQVNRDGEYRDVPFSPQGENRYPFELETHYQVTTDFLILGVKPVRSFSQPFYLSRGTHYSFADDTHTGISYKAKARFVTTVSGIKIFTGEDFYRSAIAFKGNKGRYTTTMFGAITRTETDTYRSGISYRGGRSRIVKTQLGGIIIG